MLQHSGAELSAHETITAEQDRWGSIAQLAAEYETIAAAAQHDRWTTLVRGSGLTDEQAALKTLYLTGRSSDPKGTGQTRSDVT